MPRLIGVFTGLKAEITDFVTQELNIMKYKTLYCQLGDLFFFCHALCNFYCEMGPLGVINERVSLKVLMDHAIRCDTSQPPNNCVKNECTSISFVYSDINEPVRRQCTLPQHILGIFGD